MEHYLRIPSGLDGGAIDFVCLYLYDMYILFLQLLKLWRLVFIFQYILYWGFKLSTCYLQAGTTTFIVFAGHFEHQIYKKEAHKQGLTPVMICNVQLLIQKSTFWIGTGMSDRGLVQQEYYLNSIVN